MSVQGERYHERSKAKDTRIGNIIAAKAVSDAVRTSLGPRGMDKMIQKGDGEVVITNDGATILAQMQVFHPTAKMLVELSKSQDIEAGDGTTSVVVIAGALLNACQQLLDKGIHPTVVSDAFKACVDECERILIKMSLPIELTDRARLIDAVTTCLSSKVISQNSDILAPISVDAILRIIDPIKSENVDLNDIKICKQLGGTVDDAELVDGLVFEKGCKKAAGGPSSIKNAKIALIQFCLSAPKTDMENNVVISDYAAMDRILREERKYILALCKKIKKSGANVLLIQKSILRDAYNDLSLHFLAKFGIMVITDIERTDVEFICRTVGCQPVAHVDSLVEEKLGSAGLCTEVSVPGGTHKVCKITEVKHPGQTMTILLRGSNKLLLDEADRSVHDALCVMRSLVKKRFMIAGGAAAETEMSLQLTKWAKETAGMNSFCGIAFAEALEVVPYTLAENAGLHPIGIVTELRKKHDEGMIGAGINVRKGTISDMYENNVIQPLLVSLSAMKLATECVCMILKIDDVVAVM